MASDSKTADPVDNSLRTAMAWMVKRHIEKELAWVRSPLYQKFLADYRARWAARPWYERGWIRTKSKVSGWRIRLGEIIAGRRFDND